MFLKMAPIQDIQQQQQQQVIDGPQNAIDYHFTQPMAIDLLQPHELLRLFHEFCAITNLGSTLRIIEKRYSLDGHYLGFVETSLPLPEQFNGHWCRFFHRNYDTHILVMDYDQRDFVIYNLSENHRLGRWMLPIALPDGAFLTAVETLPSQQDFRLIYSLDGNDYSVQQSFNEPQWGHWDMMPEPAAAVH